MRYRKLSATGDFVLGPGAFYVNSPDAVAQAVLTRLNLHQAEWFVDITDGTPWGTQILGKRNGRNYDAALRQRILGTQGVQEILSYSSTYNGNTRTLTVNATLSTIYGTTTITGTF
jgi:hypothetical protein